jgi:hypothetical protein
MQLSDRATGLRWRLSAIVEMLIYPEFSQQGRLVTKHMEMEQQVEDTLEGLGRMARELMQSFLDTIQISKQNVLLFSFFCFIDLGVGISRNARKPDS